MSRVYSETNVRFAFPPLQNVGQVVKSFDVRRARTHHRFCEKFKLMTFFFICRRLKKQTNPLGVNQEEQMQTLNQTQEHFVVVVERWGGVCE